MIKSQKGQATVELAFSLIILVFLLFLIIDFGRIFHTYLTLEHASREAARVASVGGTDIQVIQRVNENAASLSLDQILITQNPSQQSRRRGTYVTINLTYPVSLSIPLLRSVLPDPVILSVKTVMRVE